MFVNHGKSDSSQFPDHRYSEERENGHEDAAGEAEGEGRGGWRAAEGNEGSIASVGTRATSP